MAKKYVNLNGDDILTVEVPAELKSMQLLAGTELEVSEEEILEYLDDLRLREDAPNMLGAAPYLQDEFDLDRKEAKAILVEWMQSKRHPK